MDHRNALNAAMDKLAAMNKITQELSSLENLTNAHTVLWADAVERADGKAEGAEREILHSYLDQCLDLRQKSLQLVKEIHSLPMPKL